MVVDAAARVLGDDGVAHGQHGEELAQRGRGGVRGVRGAQVLRQQRGVGGRVHGVGHAALAELHDVAGERAGLVAEHVAHHAQLLVEVGGARQRRRVRLRVVHLAVHRDELRLGRIIPSFL